MFNLFMIFVFPPIALVVFIILKELVTSRSGTKQSSQSPRKANQNINSIDSQNPPVYFSSEMRDQIQKIAEYYGVRYVTGVETRKWILHNLSEDFAAMPGWDIWDSSIHEASGQFERAERAAMDEGISVLSYDPQISACQSSGKNCCIFNEL